ncbi:MAG: hypothetical protein RMH84_00495 [Sulfolobales archaeon]|nr:hypothetical protein [Sulfolobales archaeon]MCX8209036.1 hypothetical protein [Sulfolobales archaeon]MDW8010067.1 hypothetical protein [Sulfolobales archaeon]
MKCAEVLSLYHRVLSDARDFRILGSTEAALSIVKAFAEVVGNCQQDLPMGIDGLVRAAVEARPTSQAVRNLLQMFIEKSCDRISQQRVAKASLNLDTGSVVREVENYVLSAREAASELALKRIENGDTILTHSYSTTVLRLLTKAPERGLNISVYATESRPGGEGKLTASYLRRVGIKTTLIVDSAVRYVMKSVDKVFVSAEAIAANGAVVNKVGTSAIALAAKEARVRVYVVSGLYKFGTETVFGDLVAIEEAENPELVVPSERMSELAPYLGRNLHVRTPLYDVTPPEYVDAIITERGLVAPQLAIYLARELMGWPKERKTLESTISELVSLWR